MNASSKYKAKIYSFSQWQRCFCSCPPWKILEDKMNCSSRCVVYVRASTPKQTIGDSFSRQLDACISYARTNGFYVKGVFGDCCPGDLTMPNRSLAYIASRQLNCPILVETPCRWSRMTHGADPLVDAKVIFTSPTHQNHRQRCQQIVQDILEETCGFHALEYKP